MQNKLKVVLPWVAMVAAVLMVLLFVLGSNQRQEMLLDTGETRSVVDSGLANLLDGKLQAGNDAVILEALQRFSSGRFIAQTWFFAPDGSARFMQGGPLSKDAFNLENRVTSHTRSVLAALPQNELNADQEKMIKISSAIQAEGDHQDVFRYLVRPVKAVDGSLLGYLAVAYDINPGIEGSSNNAGYIILLSLLALSALIYWLCLPIWTWLDARQRGERAWVWALFVLLGNLVALLAYMLVRQPARIET